MPTTVDSDFAVVIPARYESTRFPGKPLADIAGRSMIERVWRLCAEAVGAENAVVATDDERIADACAEFGARAIWTSSDCLTGTDRVAEAARQLDHAFVVNVQGDEPLIRPSDIHAVAEAYRAAGGAVVNAMTEIRDEGEYWSRTVPKVVAAPNGRLLYMSRAGIPANKQGTFERAWKQVCIYAFSREHLEQFSKATAKGPIEAIEDIEILRFLDMDIPVFMTEVEAGSIAVDTPEDLERVIALFSD
jgi:3-deoxy-manno-octulosonate cytidylyltransferase (CMP-KDO synthetase)